MSKNLCLYYILYCCGCRIGCLIVFAALGLFMELFKIIVYKVYNFELSDTVGT